ncbi:MAG: hypothetical protein ABI577_04945 [bacterium]
MVTHVSYLEEQYPNPQQCVAGIRVHVERGWEVSQLRGPAAGPFVVVFRMQDREGRPETPPTSLAAGTR